jgi:predicted ester cyclase
MTIEANKALVRRGYELLSKGDWEAIRKLVAPNFVDRNPVPGQTPGLESFLESRKGLMYALTDFAYAIEDLVAEGDKVAVRLTESCTHRGELWGLAPTNKRVTYTETTISRIAKGKFVDRWCNSDSLSLLQQLGGVSVKVALKPT